MNVVAKKYKVGEHANGAISFQGGAIWPYRLVTSVLDSLLRLYPCDFSIETHTSVENISMTRSSSQPFIIHTPRGDILASHIVHATNAHTANLVPGLRGKLFPVRGTMSAQRPGKDFPRLDGSRSWCLINKKGYEYITQRPGEVDAVDGMGGEIMIGGGMNQSGRKGLGEFGIASDAETNYLSGCHLGGVLPMGFGLSNWGDDAPGGRMKSMWSGSLGLTADKLPFVGRLEPSLTGRTPLKVTQPKDTVRSITHPGEWISAGYNGEGMVNAWLCGVALGLMILGREELVTPKMPGKPHGKLNEWFPEEYICTQERVTKASIYQLLESR
jgi:glycine/D-amino acid oxidase-like deaminating enzyme